MWLALAVLALAWLVVLAAVFKPGQRRLTQDDINAAVLKTLVKHPLTDKGLAAFASDWEKTGQSIL